MSTTATTPKLTTKEQADLWLASFITQGFIGLLPAWYDLKSGNSLDAASWHHTFPEDTKGGMTKYGPLSCAWSATARLSYEGESTPWKPLTPATVLARWKRYASNRKKSTHLRIWALRAVNAYTARIKGDAQFADFILYQGGTCDGPIADALTQIAVCGDCIYG